MRVSSLVVSLLFSLFLAHYANATCSQSQYNSENFAYTNQLNDILSSVYDNLHLPQDTVRQYLGVIEKSFRDSFAQVSGCSYQGTHGNIVEDNQDLWRYMQTYRYRGVSVEPEVVSAVQKTEALLRDLIRFPRFSTCWVSNLRDSVVDYIIQCGNGKAPGAPRMELNVADLSDVPMPDIDQSQNRPTQFEKNLYAFVNIFAKGFLQVANCESEQGQKIRTIVGGLSKHLYDNIDALGISSLKYADFCDATEALNDCLCIFEEKCEAVMSCFNDLVNDFGSNRGKVFSVGKAIVWGVQCGRLETEALQPLIKRGKDLFIEFKSIAQKGQREKPQLMKQLGTVVKTIVNANFRTDSCGCENVPEIRDALASCR